MTSATMNIYNDTNNNLMNMGISGGVMVSKLDQQTYMNEFEPLSVPIHMALCHNKAKSLVNYNNTMNMLIKKKIEILKELKGKEN